VDESKVITQPKGGSCEIWSVRSRETGQGWEDGPSRSTHIGLAAQHVEGLSAAEHPGDAVEREHGRLLDAELVVQLRVDPGLDHADDRLPGEPGDLVEGRGADLRDNVRHRVQLVGRDDRRPGRLVRVVRELRPLAGCERSTRKKYPTVSESSTSSRRSAETKIKIFLGILPKATDLPLPRRPRTPP
jgi:hypothetical protein